MRQDGWNVFDSVVVLISIVGLVVPSLPAVNIMRLIRVFKMLRLLRNLTSLRIQINALTRSIFPVSRPGVKLKGLGFGV